MDNRVPELTQEEIDYIRDDNIIQAVRSARHRLGVDLIIAKRFVEEKAREMGWKPWSERNAPPKPSPADELAAMTADRDRLRAELALEKEKAEEAAIGRRLSEESLNARLSQCHEFKHQILCERDAARAELEAAKGALADEKKQGAEVAIEIMSDPVWKFRPQRQLIATIRAVLKEPAHGR